DTAAVRLLADRSLSLPSKSLRSAGALRLWIALGTPHLGDLRPLYPCAETLRLLHRVRVRPRLQHALRAGRMGAVGDPFGAPRGCVQRPAGRHVGRAERHVVRPPRSHDRAHRAPADPSTPRGYRAAGLPAAMDTTATDGSRIAGGAPCAPGARGCSALRRLTPCCAPPRNGDTVDVHGFFNRRLAPSTSREEADMAGWYELRKSSDGQ